MNEMYNMSIVTHYYSVIGILIVIFVNILMLNRANNVKYYQRQMSIFTPIGSMAIGGIIFTGVIMMASKHLEFSIENIIMIIFAVAIILLEVKRAKSLKYLNLQIKSSFSDFKKRANLILISEIILTLSISSWMWL